MDATPEAWRRLGEMLVARRVQLDPRYRSRKLFATETGSEERLLSDIERARRTNFSPETIARFEQAYAWAPGSIRAVLQGGEPTGTANLGMSATLSATSSLTATAEVENERPVIPDHPPPDLPRDLAARYGNLTATERAILWLPDLTPGEREQLVSICQAILNLRDDAATAQAAKDEPQAGTSAR